MDFIIQVNNLACVVWIGQLTELTRHVNFLHICYLFVCFLKIIFHQINNFKKLIIKSSYTIYPLFEVSYSHYKRLNN